MNYINSEQNNQFPHSQNKMSNINKPNKKKGHAPAHQNKFAFYHNPKSKKTAQIMESKISNVCQKCREKLEWRKKYRKYKPLTQPSICNICRNRNITAAYHTICYSCSRHSEKAKSILSSKRETGGENDDLDANTATADDIIDTRSAICAICVQVPAMLEDNEEEMVTAALGSERDFGHLSLRQKKSMLRKQQQRRKSNHTTNMDDKDSDLKSEEGSESDEDGGGDEGNDGDDDGSEPCQGRILLNDGKVQNGDVDPLIEAVGGADKLFVEEAYQNHLLKKLEQNPII